MTTWRPPLLYKPPSLPSPHVLLLPSILFVPPPQGFFFCVKDFLRHDYYKVGPHDNNIQPKNIPCLNLSFIVGKINNFTKLGQLNFISTMPSRGLNMRLAMVYLKRENGSPRDWLS